MNPTLQQLLATVQADSTVLLQANAAKANAQAAYDASISAFVTASANGNQAAIQAAATQVLTANAAKTAAQAAYAAAVATLETDRMALLTAMIAAIPTILPPP
jgi:hypothetical protein